jgi:hypothetical protein
MRISVTIILILSMTIQVMTSHVQAYTLSPLKQIKSDEDLRTEYGRDVAHRTP